MLGLVKKDFFIIKANLKSMLIIFFVYFIMTLQGSFDIAFVIPIIGVMLFISTFSYDDFNNWNAYAVTFPNGRKNVVRAKYVSSIFFMIVLTVISFAVSILVNYFRVNNIDIESTISSLMGTVLSVVIMISLLYPIIFKFGSTNGRIILFAVVFGIAAIAGFIAKFVDMSFIIDTVNLLENYVYVAIPIVSIILLFVSYLISNKIYKNKEF